MVAVHALCVNEVLLIILRDSVPVGDDESIEILPYIDSVSVQTIS